MNSFIAIIKYDNALISLSGNNGNYLAAGPDDLTIHHLKKLDPLGLQYLTHLFNLSVNH